MYGMNRPSTILMIRPVAFRMNEETVANNYYQHTVKGKSPASVNAQAQQEFDAMVETLREVGIEVIVVQDIVSQDTPDSVFPNNWVSFHTDGTVGLFPMFAPNRRLERRIDILETLEEQGFVIENIMDYTEAENKGVFLEATGSVVIDHKNGKAYCALSPRSNEDLFIEFCEDFEYDPVLFTSYQTVDGARLPIYHTNVMMCVGDAFAVICLDSIDDKKERKHVITQLRKSGKDIVSITESQLTSFAGNMLQVRGADKDHVVMSASAYGSLTEEQRHRLSQYGELLYSPLDTIEACGGGSARCMMAEVFLPKKEVVS